MAQQGQSLVTIDHYTDRSRTQAYQRCKRQRFHEYADGPQGRGMVPRKQSMHLTVGSAFHAAAAYLLEQVTPMMGVTNRTEREDEAVRIALAEYDQQIELGGIEADYSEGPAQALELAAAGISSPAAQTQPSFAPVQDSPFADIAGMEGLSGAQAAQLDTVERNGAEVFAEELAKEQRALVEALVRAWARRGLPRLLEQYEVLEVEREGMWVLGEWDDKQWGMTESGNHIKYETVAQHRLWWMSRHDGLLLDRTTRQLVILSFKTTGAIDGRKLRDARRDMQGLSEAVDIENRLREWHQTLRETGAVPPFDDITPAMERYLRACGEVPPRVDAVRYEFVLKGERWKDDELTRRCGFECRRARTPLLQAWVPTAGIVASPEDALGMLKHSFAWVNELGENKRLYYKNVKRAQVWELLTVGEWIALLDEGKVQPDARQPGDLGRTQDVLADVCPPPVMVYRTEDDMRDWLEQVEAQERQVVGDVARVQGAAGEGERRTLLNQLFAQTRTACSYPGECAFAPICYGSPEVRRDPLGSGKYRVRVANHPQENGNG